MNRIADCHMHTEFSTDSEAKMESMVERAIALGMPVICLTDHYDMDFENGEFYLDTPSYADKVKKMQEKYAGWIEVRFGVELGLQTHLKERLEAYVREWPFDQIIGSIHLVNGKDPYYRENFPEWDDETLYRTYFRLAAENLRSFHDFQIFGHLDYVVRYGYSKAKEYSYRKYADEIDEILRLLLQYQIALEINTGGFKYGLGFPNPHPDILKRYRELGGELISFGADAHVPEYVGYEFERAKDLAEGLGFTYYTRFKRKKPEFIKF